MRRGRELREDISQGPRRLTVYLSKSPDQDVQRPSPPALSIPVLPISAWSSGRKCICVTDARASYFETRDLVTTSSIIVNTEHRLDSVLCHLCLVHHEALVNSIFLNTVQSKRLELRYTAEKSKHAGRESTSVCDAFLVSRS